MSTNFKGKHIALTGAASGIGLATATLLASRGAILSLADIQESALTAASHKITTLFPSATITSAPVDVRSRSAVESWVSSSVTTHGALDGAVNLAGVIGKQIGISNIEDTDDEEWDFVMGVNFKGTLNCLRAEIRAVRDGGSLVNCSSIAGLMASPKNSAYIASKHAVVGLTRAAAKEQGPRGVRVNAICPGPIDTPMVQSLPAHGDKNPLLPFIPLGREGKAEEVAELICWLLCDGSSYMTGTMQSIDGGWAC